ncbi:hypothetical protein Tsubulata_044626 [Turnera subulata]|uniref:Uncharacterized protein n=1 Tax=Turnera subulata TaxID=218843 RepID=A0A9Q0GH86_9ROSI|nr:hypothetical protein Tsubulata_044626 [Turnera subulata]
MQCSLSTASPSTSTSTAVLDPEKLRLPWIESHSVAASRSWTYTGTIGPPKEVGQDAVLGIEGVCRESRPQYAVWIAGFVSREDGCHPLKADVSMVLCSLQFAVRINFQGLIVEASAPAVFAWILEEVLWDEEFKEMIADVKSLMNQFCLLYLLLIFVLRLIWLLDHCQG